VVEYNESFLLIFGKRKFFTHSPSLTAHLRMYASGIERDGELKSTLLRVSKTKMVDQLKIHPTWVDQVRIGSVAMAMQVGPSEKVALGLTSAILKTNRKNWTLRSTRKPLEPLILPRQRRLFQRIGWSPSVRVWFKGEKIDQSRLG
jgi:hypothetical protein